MPDCSLGPPGLRRVESASVPVRATARSAARGDVTTWSPEAPAVEPSEQAFPGARRTSGSPGRRERSLQRRAECRDCGTPCSPRVSPTAPRPRGRHRSARSVAAAIAATNVLRQPRQRPTKLCAGHLSAEDLQPQRVPHFEGLEVREGQRWCVGGHEPHGLRAVGLGDVELGDDTRVRVCGHGRPPRPSSISSLTDLPLRPRGQSVRSRARKSGHETRRVLHRSGTRVATTRPRLLTFTRSPSSIHVRTRAKRLRRSRTVARLIARHRVSRDDNRQGDRRLVRPTAGGSYSAAGTIRRSPRTSRRSGSRHRRGRAGSWWPSTSRPRRRCST